MLSKQAVLGFLTGTVVIADKMSASLAFYNASGSPVELWAPLAMRSRSSNKSSALNAEA
jgi:hypothetical protein